MQRTISIDIQIADVLEAHEAQLEATAQLKRLEDEQRWLGGLLQTHREIKGSLVQYQGPLVADTWSNENRFAVEEVSQRLRWVQTEIKRVSNLCRGRDSVENTLMDSLAEIVQQNKEA